MNQLKHTPKGWRQLQCGEVLRDGDMFYKLTGDSRSLRHYQSTEETGNAVAEHGSTDCEYIRQMTPQEKRVRALLAKKTSQELRVALRKNLIKDLERVDYQLATLTQQRIELTARLAALIK